jgi:VanZ family protein
VLPLRFPWLWLILGWLLVIGVCVGSLMPGSGIPNIRMGDKFVHAGSYFLLMIWFAGLYARRRHFIIAIVLVVLGFVLDALQGTLPSRSFDMWDVAANTAGIAVGWAVSALLLEGWCQRIERRLFA